MDLFDSEGQAVVHVAVTYNQLESVQVLAMNGVNLNITDPLGNTPLHVSQYMQLPGATTRLSDLNVYFSM